MERMGAMWGNQTERVRRRRVAAMRLEATMERWYLYRSTPVSCRPRRARGSWSVVVTGVSVHVAPWTEE